jgi:hypothetical protein
MKSARESKERIIAQVENGLIAFRNYHIRSSATTSVTFAS